jgi:hypothetical protein
MATWSGLMRYVGGYAVQQRDLRLLYAAVFLSFLGASVTFPLRLLYAQAHHATPAELGVAGAAGAIGGAAAAFVSLPLYHESRPLPFTVAGVAMAVGSVVAAADALALGRQRRVQPPQTAVRPAEVGGG